MGLNTTHSCWNGPYSQFNGWRTALAQAAGLPPLDLMQGFWKGPAVILNPSDLEKQLPISWNCLKEDPLFELLNHSDCDGMIPWEVCEPISCRLNILIPKMPEEWQEETRMFSKGLIDAAKAHENVEFG